MTQGKILVTGGAGYIGSATARALKRAGHEPLILDDLRSGHEKACAGMALIRGDAGDSSVLKDIFKKNKIQAVFHFAASIEVGESVEKPSKYWRNNFVTTLSLLEAMDEAGIKKLVFSSTAAVYGDAKEIPIREESPRYPVNPYGWAKWACEGAIEGFSTAHGLKAVRLRYFNAAGADPGGDHGDAHLNQTRLVTMCLKAAMKKIPKFTIFGSDYPTPDGTCVRDYIHVEDLAGAHLAALSHLEAGREGGAFSLGNGEGYSVRQVVGVSKKVSGVDYPVVEGPRRPGDPPSLVADSSKARKVLGWTPKYPKLEDIIGHAWAWHQKHPEGYGH